MMKMIKATAHNIIKKIIISHGYYQEEADEKVEKLFDKLKSLDEKQYGKWKEIVEYWDYANGGLQVKDDVLLGMKQAEINESQIKTNDDGRLGMKQAEILENQTKINGAGQTDGTGVAIVVLGLKLNDDGSMSKEMVGRLQVALTCAIENPNAYVIVSGGGTAKDNPQATEGDLMGKWMLENGLAPERLVIENRSASTVENAEFTYEILKEYPDINAIVLVSSSYHIPRASLIFNAWIIQNGGNILEISNAAYALTGNKSDPYEFQIGSLLELIGEKELAREVYDGRFEAAGYE